MRKRFKFGNKPTVVDGIKFHSKREAKRYDALRLMERCHAISDLRRQVKYRLEVNGVLIATYTADFVYKQLGEEVVEDVKGYPNDRWPMKKKLMKAIHGIEILET
jgi:hypothetical protein